MGEIRAIARCVVEYLTQDFVDNIQEEAKKNVEEQEPELSFVQVMRLLDISRSALHKRCQRKSIDFHERNGKKFFYVTDIKKILPYKGGIQESNPDCMACEGRAV